MKLLSVNVGLPREIEWNGRIIRTSIFKAPISSRASELAALPESWRKYFRKRLWNSDD